VICPGSRSRLDGSIVVEARGSVGPARDPREPRSARRRREEEEQDGGGGRPEDEGHELVERVLLAPHLGTPLLPSQRRRCQLVQLQARSQEQRQAGDGGVS
jgi:hypothetical protein